MKLNYPSAETLFEATEPLVTVEMVMDNKGHWNDWEEFTLWVARGKFSEGFVTRVSCADDLLDMPRVVPMLVKGRLN